MGRNPAQNEASRERTKARLLTAAMRLFAEEGADRVSVAKVASAARISKGLVYHYFATKDDLIAAVLEKRVEEVTAAFAELPASLSEAERLRASALALVQAVRKNPEGYRVVLRALTHPEGGDALRRVVRARADVFRARAATAAKVFERLGAKDPALEVRFFQAAMVGILVLQATSPLADSPDRLVERLLQAVGIGGKS